MRAVASIFVAVAAAAQPAFKSGVELVTVPITVTNAARDQLITTGLEADDFRLQEDGVPQTIASLSRDRQPLSVCVVVDASGSMASTNRYGVGLRALQRTVRGLDADDEVSIVRFAGSAAVTLPWTRGLDVRDATWDLEPGAGSVANSSITDAVKVALEQIDRASNRRRVVLVISDGFENTSVTPMSKLAKTRQQSEVVIYAYATIGPQERGPSGGPLRNVLPALVGDAGGVFWNVSTSTDAEFAAMSFLNELRYQYVLAYSPAKPFDGKYRRIRVETTLKGLAVRHRGGYLAVPATR